ncbi:MAG: NUDIX hydrolase, partial [Chloroflexota bacterium]
VPVVTERMLRRSLTGEPQPRPAEPPNGVVARQGAVMAFLYPNGNDIVVALTVRTAHLGSHAGQISLPGGRIDPDDATAWHAAVRETWEEIGVDLSGTEAWATLDQIYVAASNFFVTGFVAFQPRRPVFRLSPHEVAILLEVPVAELMCGESFWVGERDYQGQRVLEGYFEYQGQRIWGATAVLLDQLLERIHTGLALVNAGR